MDSPSVNRLVQYGMFLLGILFLTLSAFYNSYVAALAGLGLTFWGALLLCLAASKYVKLEILNTAAFSALVNIEKILSSEKQNLKGVYLPPHRLQDYTSSLVFISSQPNQPLPISEETNPQELRPKNHTGFLITPPGLALSKLFEKELKKQFTETSLGDLQTQLPKVLDELQITKHLNIQPENNNVTVTIRNHVFEDLFRETAKLELTHKTVGCPLSSALACAFAKATGKPVTIEKEETTPEGTTTIQYSILEN